MAPRPTDRTPSEAPIRTTTPRGDTGHRYRTPDARGSGSNEIETDHMGIVRSLSTTDAVGLRASISGARLASLLSGSPAEDSARPHGWSVARSGRGDSATTTVTAPDGRTTYTLDNHGRLTGDVGTHYITPPTGMIPIPMAPGTRYDSTGAAGELRTARTNFDGVLEGVSIRTLADGYRELKPEKWGGLKPNETRDLGDGWTARRGYFHGVHYDGTSISHTDGTTYILNPKGQLVYANNPIEAADAEKMPRERATVERKAFGSFADDGARYSTPDRRGTGTNHLDVDRLGRVRGFAHTALGDVARTLSMEHVDKIPADGMPRPMPKGWTASRTGTGSESVTTVVAPDGATTYRIDSTGALMIRRSSVDIPYHRSVVSADIDRGGRRVDSLMSDGRIASGYTTADGTLSHITLKDKTGRITTITREQWEKETNGPFASGDNESGTTRGQWKTTHVPGVGRMIYHSDGTRYYLGPKGELADSYSSSDAMRQRLRPS